MVCGFIRWWAMHCGVLSDPRLEEARLFTISREGKKDPQVKSENSLRRYVDWLVEKRLRTVEQGEAIVDLYLMLMERHNLFLEMVYIKKCACLFK